MAKLLVINTVTTYVNKTFSETVFNFLAEMNLRLGSIHAKID